jgi:hypothetical protein
MHLVARTRRLHSLFFSKPLKKAGFALFLSVLLSGLVAHAQTSIPDTPAGKVSRAWLDAFNSGDRAKVEAYIEKFDPQQSFERMMGFRDQTGGFQLLAIESSGPLLIKFRVKEKASPTVGIGSIQLKMLNQELWRCRRKH